jgi:hypothetical protein
MQNSDKPTGNNVPRPVLSILIYSERFEQRLRNPNPHASKPRLIVMRRTPLDRATRAA